MKIACPRFSPIVSSSAYIFAFILTGCGEQASANRAEVAVPVVYEKELTNGDYFARLQKEAETGNAESQFNLGRIYMRGEGYTGVTFMRDVPKDPAKALEWYQKAGDQGHIDAQYNAGMIYKLGLGVKEDSGKAFLWLQKAAAHGHDLAQYYLGVMYADGTGVKRDLPRACAWLTLAAAQGNEKAVKDYPEFDAKLTQVQREEGLQLAAGWKKGEAI